MAQDSTAYKFSLFEPYEYGTEAPQLEPVYEPDVPVKRKAAPKKKVHQGMSASEKREAWASVRKSAVVMLSVFFVFSVISIAIYLNVTLDETARQITSVQSNIDIAKSENVRLASTLEGMVSIDKVEDYAVNVLGMVKLDNYKITYFQADNGNHVVISGGKSYDSSGTISAKIKNLMEYIF